MPTSAQIQARREQLIKEGDDVEKKIEELRRAGKTYPDLTLMRLVKRQGEICMELMNLSLK